jgi:hypothetical protein
MRSGKIKGREVEELGDSALSYGQVKAAATGDVLVLEQADLNVTVTHLQRLRSAHARARRRDAQEAAHARNYAADAVARADRLKDIVERADSAEVPGFTNTRGTPIADRTQVGEFIADRVQVLLKRDSGGQEWLGRWSDTEIRLQVSKLSQAYMVDLLLGGASGGNPIRVRVWQEWLVKGQCWRFAHAIEQLIVNADNDAAHEVAVAEEALARANDFELRSRETFPQEEELARRSARKNELDAYTALVAAAREDADKRAEVEAMRARLLKDAPSDFSEVPVTMPARIAPPRRRPQLVKEPAAKSSTQVADGEDRQVASASYHQQVIPLASSAESLDNDKSGSVPQIVSLDEQLQGQVEPAAIGSESSQEAHTKDSGTSMLWMASNWREFAPQRSSRRKRKAVVEIPVSWLVEGSEEGGPEIKQQFLFSEMTEGPAKTLFDLMEPATHEITQGQPKRRRERKSKQNAA